MEKMNLMQRLNAVMKKVSMVEKDKVIGTGNYAYGVATYDEVLSRVREHLVEVGVLVITNQPEPGRMVGTGTFYGGRDNKPGVEAMRYEAMYEVAFINVDDPTQTITMRVEAHAIDQGDKAPGKAQTYATKAALKKTLLLETGEEGEEDRVERSPETKAPEAKSAKAPEAKSAKAPEAKSAKANGKTIAAGQVAFLSRKLTEKKREAKDLCTAVGAEALDKITESAFPAAIEWLKSA